MYVVFKMIKSYFVKYKQEREEKLKSIWLDIEIDEDQVSASLIEELIIDKIYNQEYVRRSEIVVKSVSLL